MRKRKRGADPSSPIHLTSSDDVSSSDSVLWSGDSSSESEVNGVPISSHRTCWVHTLGSLAEISKEVAEQVKKCYSNAAPCYLGDFPHRKRSRRRSQSKNLVCKQNKRLNSGQFESYMEKFWSSLPEDQETSLTYFDSVWFALYRKMSRREEVLSWITRKQIFSKKYVFVPIVCWEHWNLLIFCHFGDDLQSKTRTRCMLLLDSLQASDPRSRFESDIRKFVLDIFRAEGRPEKKQMIQKIPLLVPKVPQQRDGDECGNFVMHFIKSFVKSAPENFNLDGYPYFMRKDWFDPDGLECS